MGSDLLLRVRWGNVARAGVVVVVVGAVVAWPRLTPTAPRVPDQLARPLATAAPEPTAVAAPHVVAPVARPAPRRSPRHHHGRPRRRPRRRVVAPRPSNPGIEGGETAAPVAESETARGRATPAPTQGPAQTEFGFER
jgi:hypothetical protein